MKAQVLLPKIFNFPITYNSNRFAVHTGDIVEVPFGQKKEIGVVWPGEILKLKNVKIKKINMEDNPKTANPATPSPITVPPLKATFIALGKLVLAASAVLTLALVAILIPILPASAEKTAPITNETTINNPAGIKFKADSVPRAVPEINTKTANILYSAFKNANAPLAM